MLLTGSSTTYLSFARGDLDQRVQISTKDEFGELGEAFNTMASNLEQLKADIQRKEREATLGLIASGLVHDLKHPFKNIENMTRLIDRLFDNAEYRTTFKTKGWGAKTFSALVPLITFGLLSLATSRQTASKLRLCPPIAKHKYE